MHQERGAAAALDERAAARLLALTIHSTRVSGASGQLVVDLVTATRNAIHNADDPEQTPSPDPLPASAVLLRDIYTTVVSAALATRYVGNLRVPATSRWASRHTRAACLTTAVPLHTAPNPPTRRTQLTWSDLDCAISRGRLRVRWFEGR